MFCSQCGTQLHEGARFCHNCGAPVAMQAPGIDNQVSPAPDFCLLLLRCVTMYAGNVTLLYIVT